MAEVPSTRLYIGGKRVGDEITSHVLVENVKWLWTAPFYVNFNNPPTAEIPGTEDTGPIYGETEKTLTANANVQIPAAIRGFGAGTNYVPNHLYYFGYPTPPGGGPQVGDRIAYIDDWWGGTGFYEIVDLGQNGIRPWQLRFVQELVRGDELLPARAVIAGISASGEHRGLEIVIGRSDWPWNVYAVFQIRQYPGPFKSEDGRGGGDVLGGGQAALDCVAIGGGSALFNGGIAIGNGAVCGSNYAVLIASTQGAALRKATGFHGPGYTGSGFLPNDEYYVFYSGGNQTLFIQHFEQGSASEWADGVELLIVQAYPGAVTLAGEPGITLLGDDLTTSGMGSMLIARHAPSFQYGTWVVTCVPAPSALAKAPMELSGSVFDALAVKDPKTFYVVTR
jgi:hypothetical protein